MSTLWKLLANTDDDYLVGLSNKGIVKRAYKDLEGTNPMVTWEEEAASVNLGEETCQIRIPLGESSCSCPSRSICRHVVSAILWLKAQDVGEKRSEVEETKIDESSEAGDKAKTDKKEPIILPPKQELLDIPVKKLRNACGAKRYRQFYQKLKTKEKPE